jgi:photosynthetic reaction center H subunit
MPTGALTAYLDVAQVVLYVFWAFFFALIVYLRREDKREGFPLESEDPHTRVVSTIPSVPSPKTFLLADGRKVQAPRDNGDKRVPALRKSRAPYGSPFDPVGDPMAAGVGPGSWAERHDTPDVTMEGHPRIVPMRAQHEIRLHSRDPDPIGMAVVGADGMTAGTVVDVWVDCSEMVLRYLEVEVAVTAEHQRVLLPMNMTKVHRKIRRVDVVSINAAQFAGVPTTAHPEQVTLLEEERIMAYYGGGYLYASHPVDEAIA